MTDEKTLRALEFDKIKAAAAAYAESSRGAEEVNALAPTSSLDEARDRTEYTRQAFSAMYDALVNPPLATDDLREIFAALRKQAVLSPAELLKVALLLRCASGFVSAAQKLPADGYGKIKDAAASM